MGVPKNAKKRYYWFLIIVPFFAMIFAAFCNGGLYNTPTHLFGVFDFDFSVENHFHYPNPTLPD